MPMASIQLSIRMDSDIKMRLEKEARLEDRSSSYIIQKALDQYLSVKERRRQDLEDAIAEADKGIFVSGEAVERWVLSWDTDDELPEPEPDIYPAK
jgi:predicted transcriptional regulator